MMMMSAFGLPGGSQVRGGNAACGGASPTGE